MTNSKSLSSDIDFIKEFEELKIKQKLLVETLSKKKNALKDETLLNMNSKLDFLVTLFKDANKSDEENDPHKEIIDSFENLTKRIDSLEENFNNKFEKLEENIANSLKNTHSNIIDSIKEESQLDYSDVKKKLSSHKDRKIVEKSNDLAPTPEFKISEDVKIEGKIDEISNIEEKKKKKKWF